MDLNDIKIPIILLLCFVQCGWSQWPQPLDYQKEQSLRDHIFTTNNYNPMIRPSEVVDVQVGLIFYSLKNLDLKGETMESAISVTLGWFDSRFNGQSLNHSIDYIYIDPKDVWVPRLYMLNSLNSKPRIHDEDGLVLASTAWGYMSWLITLSETTHCYVDVTYYPFDTQTCDFAIALMGQLPEHIDLNFHQYLTGTMDFFRTNGEWEFRGNNSFKLTTDAYGQKSVTLIYTFTFRRRPAFHVINSLIPVTLFSTLSCAVYKLPADSGEKVGFGLTVLLGFAVYLTILTNFIPSTSLNTSYLSIYLVVVLAMCVVSVFITLWVLDCHHSDKDRPIPKCLAFMVRYIFMPISCRSKRTKCKKMTKTCNKHKMNGVENIPTDINDIPEPYDDMDEELSWQEIGKSIDGFAFIITVVVTIVVTVLTYVAFIYGYINSGSTYSDDFGVS